MGTIFTQTITTGIFVLKVFCLSKTSLPPKSRDFNISDVPGTQAIDSKRITPCFESEDPMGRLSSFVDIRSNKGVLDYWLRKYGKGYCKHWNTKTPLPK